MRRENEATVERMERDAARADEAYERSKGDSFMDAMPIPAEDRERIESLVAQYRSQVENLYRMAYMQGEIDSSKTVVKKLRGES